VAIAATGHAVIRFAQEHDVAPPRGVPVPSVDDRIEVSPPLDVVGGDVEVVLRGRGRGNLDVFDMMK
jgi:hypothetical protein